MLPSLIWVIFSKPTILKYIQDILEQESTMSSEQKSVLCSFLNIFEKDKINFITRVTLIAIRWFLLT